MLEVVRVGERRRRDFFAGFEEEDEELVVSGWEEEGTGRATRGADMFVREGKSEREERAVDSV